MSGWQPHESPWARTTQPDGLMFQNTCLTEYTENTYSMYTCCFRLLSFMVIRYVLKSPTVICGFACFSFKLSIFCFMYFEFFTLSFFLTVSKACHGVSCLRAFAHASLRSQCSTRALLFRGWLFLLHQGQSNCHLPKRWLPQSLVSKIDTLPSTITLSPVILPMFFMAMIIICNWVVSSFTCFSYCLGCLTRM